MCLYKQENLRTNPTNTPRVFHVEYTFASTWNTRGVFVGNSTSLLYLPSCKKQPQEVFCNKGVLKNFANITGKHRCWSLFLLQLQQRRCFPVKLMKFLSTLILKNICERLVLPWDRYVC